VGVLCFAGPVAIAGCAGAAAGVTMGVIATMALQDYLNRNPITCPIDWPDLIPNVSFSKSPGGGPPLQGEISQEQNQRKGRLILLPIQMLQTQVQRVEMTRRRLLNPLRLGIKRQTWDMISWLKIRHLFLMDKKFIRMGKILLRRMLISTTAGNGRNLIGEAIVSERMMPI